MSHTLTTYHHHHHHHQQQQQQQRSFHCTVYIRIVSQGRAAVNGNVDKSARGVFGCADLSTMTNNFNRVAISTPRLDPVNPHRRDTSATTQPNVWSLQDAGYSGCLV